MIWCSTILGSLSFSEWGVLHLGPCSPLNSQYLPYTRQRSQFHPPSKSEFSLGFGTGWRATE